MTGPPQVISIHRAGKPSIHGFDRIKQPVKPTKAHPLIISTSELSAFLRCRVRWNWSYQCRLAPKRKSTALALGTLVHDILEHWYLTPHAKRTVKRMEKLARERVRSTTTAELTTQDRELAEAMCIGYAAWARDEDKSIGLTECVPEGWFRYPLVPGDESVLIHGKIDNTFAPHNLRSTRALQEFKTRSQFRNEPVDLNTQLSVYLWALRQKYPKAKRYVAYWTQLRKQMPGPRVKADLFARETVERSDEEIAQWATDVRRQIGDMLDGAIYPNPNDACSYDCDFRVPCQLRGNRKDLASIFRTEYERRP